MQFTFFKSIRTDLFMLVLISALPAIAIILYCGIRHGSLELEQAHLQASRLVESLHFEQQQAFESSRQLLTTLAKFPDIRNMDPASGTKLLSELLKQNPALRAIFILNKEGNPVCSTPATATADFLTLNLFRELIRTGSFTIGEYAFCPAAKRPLLYLASPIRDGNGRFTGAVTAALDPAYYARLYAADELPEGSTISVTDRKGLLLYPAPSGGKPEPDIPEMIERISASGEKGSFTRVGPDGSKHLNVYQSLKMSGSGRPYAFIRIGIPESKIRPQYTASLLFDLGLPSLACLIALMAAVVMGNVAIAGRLDRLVRASRRLGEGDLKARSEIGYDKGEIGELAKAFDEMAEALEKTTAESRTSEAGSRKIAEQWQTTFDSITDVVMILDTDLRIIRINRAGIHFFGLPFTDMLGQCYSKLVHGTDEPPPECPVFRMMETRRHGNADIFRPDRNDWLNIAVDPILDEHGNISGTTYIIKDITARKESEKSLRISEERYRILFNESPIALIELNGTRVKEDIDDLRGQGVVNVEKYFKENREATERVLLNLSIVDANKKAMDLFGVASVEDFNKNLSHAFTDSIPTTLRESLIAVAGRRYDYETDTVVGTFGGEPLHVHLKWTVPPEFRSSYAKVLLSFIDMTESRRSEEIIQKQKNRFEMVLENAPFGIVLIDQAGQGRYANRKYQEMFDYDFGEFPDWQSWSLRAYPDAEYREKILAEWMQGALKASPGEKIVHFTPTIVCRDGSKKIINLHSVMLSPDEFLITCEDITRQKQLESQLAQSQKMEAIGTLAGGIAHDFNNLLMAILGYTSLMLLETNASGPNYEKLKTIESQVKSGSNLTRQLLGFARGGKYEIRSVNVNNLLARTSEMFGRTRKEIRINASYEENLWPVEVDSGQIEQVFLNMLVNAWHAMPAGGQLYLKTSRVILDDNQAEIYSLKPGRYVRISITDTGIGMDEATRQRVFDPFFTTKEMGRGTGMGLASAYGIIQNHNGHITVYSKKGKGATFNIYLPASEKALPKEAEAPQKILRGTETILIVDDQDVVLTVGKNMLEALGYRVITAESGWQALDRYREHQPAIDLVLLDMIMPGMSGGETYLSLKAVNPEIKVILSSGYSLNGDAVKILEQGCNGFIQKPFDLTELSKKIRDVLG